MRSSPYSLLAALLLANACSYVGDVLGPEESETKTPGPSTGEGSSSTESATEAGTTSTVESSSGDSADWTDAGAEAGDASDTLPPMEVTDVGGDDLTTWGEEGGMTFSTGFDTTVGDGDGDLANEAISECQGLCDRLLQCALLPPPELTTCQDDCIDQIASFFPMGPECLFASIDFHSCAIGLSCTELEGQMMMNPGALCEDEFSIFQLTCLP